VVAHSTPGSPPPPHTATTDSASASDLTDQIAPEAVIPFAIDRGAAQSAVREWVQSRWFAPNALRSVNSAESLDGNYIPHRTFDAATETDYSGLRGDHYWETETYTEMVNGQSQTRTRQVMRTRWWPASGHVSRDFDDVLTPATTRLAGDTMNDLTPWSLTAATAFRPDYLSGFRTLRYDIEPDHGLAAAQQQMRDTIEGDCRADIGGDEQQVHSMDVTYGQVRFKLLLLPVWVAIFIYGGKPYQVFINGQTGQVSGQRPYSIVKIVGAVLGGLLVAGLITLLYLRYRNG
jgi:hypothetical protein